MEWIYAQDLISSFWLCEFGPGYQIKLNEYLPQRFMIHFKGPDNALRLTKDIKGTTVEKVKQECVNIIREELENAMLKLDEAEGRE